MGALTRELGVELGGRDSRPARGVRATSSRRTSSAISSWPAHQRAGGRALRAGPRGSRGGRQPDRRRRSGGDPAAAARRAVHRQGVDRAARHAAANRVGDASRVPRGGDRAAGAAADRRRRDPAGRGAEHVRSCHCGSSPPTGSTDVRTIRTTRAATAGGSSGGEGAAVGSAPRRSASAPTSQVRSAPGLLLRRVRPQAVAGAGPEHGHYPPTAGRAAEMLATGPLVRRAEDLMPLLSIMAGPDGIDSYATAMTIGDPGTVSLAELQVVTVEHASLLPISRALRDAVSARSARSCPPARRRRIALRIVAQRSPAVSGDSPGQRRATAGRRC